MPLRLRPCRVCGTKVSVVSPKCSICGAVQPTHRHLNPWVFVLGLVVLLVVLATLTLRGAELQNAELRAALHAQVKGHKVIPYSSGSRFDTADALAMLDAAAGDTNLVVLTYSGLSLPVNTFGTSTGWNREHVWPNSFGLDDQEPAYSDLHNLRACDANVNSSRGNKWFDWSSATDGKVSIPAHAEAPGTSADSNSWQPRSEERGDLARALFYMDVRYEGDVVNELDLRLVEDVGLINASTNLMGRLSVLFLWNQHDPPDERERARNEAVFALQGKRNPFVDDPTLVERLYVPRLTVSRVGETVTYHWEDTGLPVALEYAPALDEPWSGQAPPSTDKTFVRLRVLLPEQ